MITIIISTKNNNLFKSPKTYRLDIIIGQGDKIRNKLIQKIKINTVRDLFKKKKKIIKRKGRKYASKSLIRVVHGSPVFFPQKTSQRVPFGETIHATLNTSRRLNDSSSFTARLVKPFRFLFFLSRFIHNPRLSGNYPCVPGWLGTVNERERFTCW